MPPKKDKANNQTKANAASPPAKKAKASPKPSEANSPPAKKVRAEEAAKIGECPSSTSGPSVATLAPGASAATPASEQGPKAAVEAVQVPDPAEQAQVPSPVPAKPGPLVTGCKLILEAARGQGSALTDVADNILAKLLPEFEHWETNLPAPRSRGGFLAYSEAAYKMYMEQDKSFTCLVPFHYVGFAA